VLEEREREWWCGISEMENTWRFFDELAFVRWKWFLKLF